jgi:hypothetical protein
MFFQPLDTRDLNVYNKKECKVAYEAVKKQVESGVEFLLEFRKNDPYRDFIPRVLREITSGQQAPTADLN